METKLLNKLRTIQYLAETCSPVIYDEAVEAVAMLEEIIEANQFTSDLINDIRKAGREAAINCIFEKTKN